MVRSFVKWPGGKSWLAPTLAGLIGDQIKGTYYEPFVGSGSVFLHLVPDNAVLSDNNCELVSSIRTISYSVEKVLLALDRLSNTQSCYDEVRTSAPRDPIGKAVRFLYLNRTCWGGIYRLNKHGCFNVPYGNSGRVICQPTVLLSAAKQFRLAKLICSDFESVICEAKAGDVVYADPPYTTRGQNNGFNRYNEQLFAWLDQERLASVCKLASRRGALVIVSGPWHPDFLSLYEGWRRHEVRRVSTISRLSKGRRRISEALVISQ
jgi:DNA adenine methylase